MQWIPSMETVEETAVETAPLKEALHEATATLLSPTTPLPKSLDYLMSLTDTSSSSPANGDRAEAPAEMSSRARHPHQQQPPRGLSPLSKRKAEFSYHKCTMRQEHHRSAAHESVRSNIAVRERRSRSKSGVRRALWPEQGGASSSRSSGGSSSQRDVVGVKPLRRKRNPVLRLLIFAAFYFIGKRQLNAPP